MKKLNNRKGSALALGLAALLTLVGTFGGAYLYNRVEQHKIDEASINHVFEINRKRNVLKNSIEDEIVEEIEDVLNENDEANTLASKVVIPAKANTVANDEVVDNAQTIVKESEEKDIVASSNASKEGSTVETSTKEKEENNEVVDNTPSISQTDDSTTSDPNQNKTDEEPTETTPETQTENEEDESVVGNNGSGKTFGFGSSRMNGGDTASNNQTQNNTESTETPTETLEKQEEPVEKETEEPAETPTEDPVEKQEEEPVETPTETPTETPVENKEEPVEKETEEPAETTPETPEKQEEEPVETPDETQTDPAASTENTNTGTTTTTNGQINSITNTSTVDKIQQSITQSNITDMINNLSNKYTISIYTTNLFYKNSDGTVYTDKKDDSSLVGNATIDGSVYHVTFNKDNTKGEYTKITQSKLFTTDVENNITNFEIIDSNDIFNNNSPIDVTDTSSDGYTEITPITILDTKAITTVTPDETLAGISVPSIN